MHQIRTSRSACGFLRSRQRGPRVIAPWEPSAGVVRVHRYVIPHPDEPRMTAFSRPSPYARLHDMAATDEQSTYFRKGFGLKADVQDDLSADYNGRIVDVLREHDYTLTVDDVTIRLASEFGFCYGVERAVEYAYQTRRKFPDRRLLLVGEIIHNPHVNAQAAEMGDRDPRAPDADGTFDFSARARRGRRDPAGVRRDDRRLRGAARASAACWWIRPAARCSTCGSASRAYARDGFTALIHGKYYHEETRATASQVLKYPDGQLPRRARHGRSARGLRLHRGTRRRARRSSRSSRKAVVAGLRSRRASAPHRRGEPDDDARAANRWRSARRSATAIARARGDGRARDRLPHASTRSAARRRSGRTP